MEFSWNFRVLWGELSFIHLSVVFRPKSKKNRIEWKIFQGCFKKKKKKKKAHEQIEFHKTVQD